MSIDVPGVDNAIHIQKAAHQDFSKKAYTLTEIKAMPHSVATALATSVLPVPSNNILHMYKNNNTPTNSLTSPKYKIGTDINSYIM